MHGPTAPPASDPSPFPPFRLLTISHSMRRGFIKEAITVRLKAKPISKRHKCHQNCDDHLFSLRKSGPDSCNQLNKDIPDVTLSFCPFFNQVMSLTEGGAPKFLNDHRAETPCFISAFEELTEVDQQMHRSKFQKKEENSLEEMSASTQSHEHLPPPPHRITLEELECLFNRK